MKIHDYLYQPRILDDLIECKQEEARQLWALATSVTQEMSGMPHAPGVSDKVGNTVQKIIEKQNEINELIDMYVDVKDDVIRHIEMLPHKQYTVMHWRYVRKRKYIERGQKWYYTWSEIAEQLRCTEQNLHLIRKRAEKNLKKILESEKKKKKVD